MAAPASVAGESIRVCVRCRPLSRRELDGGYTRVTTLDAPSARVSLRNPRNPDDVKHFAYDALFGEASDQIGVYDAAARSIVDAALCGFNGTIFVYGQTGTGKTFTMQGEPDPPELCGIIPSAFRHIFSHIARTPERQFLVRISFLEIYNEDIRDLLLPPPLAADGVRHAAAPLPAPPPPLEIKDAPPTKAGAPGGVVVRNLTTRVVASVEDLERALFEGNRKRTVAHTLMNASSSRSHAIFSVTIESSDDAAHIWAGRLHLVDLAGSERQCKTGAVGDRLREAAKINLSLSALGNCIAALTDARATHIPYRDSKLTRLLQDSLGGNSKTLMLATISPASYNYDETLSTLRYATRAKSIKNKPIVNEDPTDALLRAYQEEILRLQGLLKAKAYPQPPTATAPFPLSTTAITTSPSDANKCEAPPSTDCAASTKNLKKRVIAGKPKSPSSRSKPTSCSPPFASLNAASDAAAADNAAIERLQAEIEEERRQMLESSDNARDEKNCLVKNLESSLQLLEDERKQRAALQEQLENLEAKLLVGGVNIVERVNKQELELERHRLLKLEEETKQRELRQLLEQQQENNISMEGDYANLQEEIDVKTRKLQRLWKKIDALKQENEDVALEWQSERAELLTSLHELVRDRDLKTLILDSFVAEQELRRLDSQLIFDEDLDDWRWINSLAAAPCATKSSSPSSPRTRTISNGTRPTTTAAIPTRAIRPASTLLWRSGAAGLAGNMRRPMCLTAKKLLSRLKLVRYSTENILAVPLLNSDESTRCAIIAQYRKSRPPQLC